MIRRVLIAMTPAPVSVDLLAEAHRLGAGEIITPLADELEIRGEFAGFAPGYYEIEYPDPVIDNG